MQCICCLSETLTKRELVSFTAVDRRLYQELTQLSVKARTKICRDCKSLLKCSSEFQQLCIKSHEHLTNADGNEEKTSNKRTRRQAKEQVEEEFFQPNDEPLNNDSSDDDSELPIAALQKQLKSNLEPEHLSPINELEASSPEPDSKKKIGKYLCPDCGISFVTSQRLQIHSYTHSGIKNWKCEYCEKDFATKFRLKAHTRIHTGEKPFVCDVCSLCFAQGNALKCHKRVHTKERPFICKICLKSFSQNTTLKTHMAALHLGKTVECDEPGCDKKFTRRSYLLIHKRDHAGERKYACNRCTKQYKQKSHLDRHIEASHLGVRHKCDFPGCSSEFSKSWSLKMHKFVHSSQPSELPYQCKTCNSGFQRRDKWLKHATKCRQNEETSVETADEEESQIEVDNVEQEKNYVILASSPEIYTIHNPDGSFTQVQTLQVVEEN